MRDCIECAEGTQAGMAPLGGAPVGLNTTRASRSRTCKASGRRLGTDSRIPFPKERLLGKHIGAVGSLKLQHLSRIQLKGWRKKLQRAVATIYGIDV